jgi:hypothetical protein
MHTQPHEFLSKAHTRVLAAGFALSLLGSAPRATAQVWTPTPGPTGSSVRGLLAGEGATLAMTPGSFFVLSHSESQWQRRANLPIDLVYSSTAEGSEFLIGRRDGKITWSPDGGQTWTTIAGPRPPASPSGWDSRVLHIEASSSAWYAMVPDSGTATAEIYRSTNHGQSWDSIPAPDAFDGPLLASDAELIALSSQFGFFRTVVRSVDSGLTWSIIGGGSEDAGGLPGSIFNESGGTPLRFGSTLVVGSYVTTDLGQSWQRMVNDSGQPMAIQFRIADRYFALRYQPSQVGTGAAAELWSSVDLSAWSRADAALPALAAGQTRAFAPRGAAILAADSSGVRTSLDLGVTWSDLNAGIITTSPGALVATTSSLVAAADLGLSLSRFEGGTWTPSPLAPNASDSILSLWSPDQGQTLLVGTNNSGMFLSTNAGQSWASIVAGIPSYGAIAGVKLREISAFTSVGSTLFAATGVGSTWLPSVAGGGHAPPASPVPTGGGVLRSTNNAQSWQNLTAGLPISRTSMFGEPIRDPILSMTSVQNAVLLGNASTGVYRSTNNGELWSAANTGLPAAASVPAMTTIADVALASVAGGMFRSTNAGASWSASASGWPEGRSAGALLTHGSVVFAGISNPTENMPSVYRSLDQGQTWQAWGAGLEGLGVSALAVRDDTLYAATSGAGVWSVTVSACVADVDDGSGAGSPDSGVTIDDLIYYLAIFGDGNPRADIDDGSSTNTPDGGVTIDDLIYFLARFEVGC